MKNGVFFRIFLALLVLQPGIVWSGQYRYSAIDTAANSSISQSGWLGVYLRPVSRSLAVQLSTFMPAGEGVMVAEVEKNSPADLAGIKQYDILLRFNDQKLYSPGQLSSLVKSTGLNKPATVELIHLAQLQTLQVKITARPFPSISRRPSRSSPTFTPMQGFPYPYIQGIQPLQNSPLAWDSFESVKVNTLADGRYHAEVSFKGQGNETRTFVFEGFKDEIVQQIRQQKDLPQDKREALLDTLGMTTGRTQMPFNRPFMQRYPFNDSFFSNRFFLDFFKRDPFFEPLRQPETWRQNYR